MKNPNDDRGRASMHLIAKWIFGAALLCLLPVTPAARPRQPEPEDFPSYIEAEHRVVLGSWLKEKPHLRPATAADLDAEFLERVKEMVPESAASPFYCVGDFNHDERKDFAVGFVDKNRPGTLILAVFNAPFGKKRAPAFYDESRFEMTDIFFVVADGRNREELQIGIGNDTKTVLLKPKGKGYFIWTGATQ
jgi:hypothetical protein